MRTLRTRPRFRLLAGAVAALGGAALLLAGATGIASAHDALASSSPADGESITSDPGLVTLEFSDELMTLGGDTGGFGIEVIDSDGLHYESGCVTVQGTSVTTPIALGLAGGYVVLWQVVSSDGHATSNQYEFDYEPTTLDGAHDGLTNAPVCGEAWAGAPDGVSTPTSTPAATTLADAPVSTSTAATAAPTDATSTATDTPASAPAAVPWPVAVLLGVVGLGVLVAIVVLVLRRSRGGGYGAS